MAEAGGQLGGEGGYGCRRCHRWCHCLLREFSQMREDLIPPFNSWAFDAVILSEIDYQLKEVCLRVNELFQSGYALSSLISDTFPKEND